MKTWLSTALAVTCLCTQMAVAQPKTTGVARFDAAVSEGPLTFALR